MKDVVEQYQKFREHEQHFNSIQAGIRTMASGWMLAAFAAIAVLLKSDENVAWLVPPAALVVIVSLMATMGLVVLWINDQMVYQRLLQSVFLVGLRWEYLYRQLPPIRAMMMCSSEGTGMSKWMVRFYTVPMLCFAAMSLAMSALTSLPTSSLHEEELAAWNLVPPASFAGQAILILWVWAKQRGLKTGARASLFGDPAFENIFRDKSFKTIIERHSKAVT